jgi:hypothetical protein
MRIRSLMLVTATVITLAVPGLASTAGAATMSGSSLSAARFVSSVSAQGAAVNTRAGSQAIVADGQKAVSVRVSCGSQECGFNGNVQWGTNYLKIWGIVWGTSSSAADVLLTWHSGGVEFLREPGRAPGRAGVGFNKYYKTNPSYIQVQVCGEASGNCSQPVDP